MTVVHWPGHNGFSDFVHSQSVYHSGSSFGCGSSSMEILYPMMGAP